VSGSTGSRAVYVYASLIREWEDFTDAHQRRRKEAEEAIDQYADLLKEKN